MAIDPVCGMEVNPAEAKWTYEYKGITYYFCGKGCMLEFKDDPEKYLDPGYVPQGM
jgi:Cu+-exporting ATPase